MVGLVNKIGISAVDFPLPRVLEPHLFVLPEHQAHKFGYSYLSQLHIVGGHVGYHNNMCHILVERIEEYFEVPHEFHRLFVVENSHIVDVSEEVLDNLAGVEIVHVNCGEVVGDVSLVDEFYFVGNVEECEET